jgi:hypothetical protein
MTSSALADHGDAAKEAHLRLTRVRSRRAMIVAAIAAALFAIGGAWGLVRSQDNPQSPFQHKHEHARHQDPFGF